MELKDKSRSVLTVQSLFQRGQIVERNLCRIRHRFPEALAEEIRSVDRNA